jgi:hypothetical protein
MKSTGLLAATYKGAIITVEGHADPLHYVKLEKEGALSKELRAIRTSEKKLLTMPVSQKG